MISGKAVRGYSRAWLNISRIPPLPSSASSPAVPASLRASIEPMCVALQYLFAHVVRDRTAVSHTAAVFLSRLPFVSHLIDSFGFTPITMRGSSGISCVILGKLRRDSRYRLCQADPQAQPRTGCRSRPITSVPRATCSGRFLTPGGTLRRSGVSPRLKVVLVGCLEPTKTHEPVLSRFGNLTQILPSHSPVYTSYTRP